jgi:hypothetical protein
MLHAKNIAFDVGFVFIHEDRNNRIRRSRMLNFACHSTIKEFQVMWKISLSNNWPRIFCPRNSIIG